MLKLNILTQTAHPRVIPRILSHHVLKLVKGFDLCTCLRIKSQKTDILPICPEVPRERIFTKLGMNVPLVEVINCDKLCDNLFKGLNFTGGRSSKFSHRNLTSPL